MMFNFKDGLSKYSARIFVNEEYKIGCQFSFLFIRPVALKGSDYTNYKNHILLFVSSGIWPWR